MKKDICVIGLGYIGLPTAAFFAKSGRKVIGFDLDSEKIELVSKGRLPFVEPGFGELLAEVVRSDHLTVSDHPQRAEVYIIAVPTPLTVEKTVDLSSVISAVDAVAPLLESGDLLILESTSPPGTTQQLTERIIEKRPELFDTETKEVTFDVAYCPERVIPGRIMVEMVQNSRVVGGTTDQSATRARQLYEEFCTGEIVETSAKTAELVKLVENSYRDVNIAFANELSVVARELGVDVWNLISIANLHPRVNILQPGPGVGGHCIAVDPWFLISSVPNLAKLMTVARLVNDEMPCYIASQIQEKIDRLKPASICCLGLAFKPDVDDLRGSPALTIVEKVARDNPSLAIRVMEPHINELPLCLADYRNIEFVSSMKSEELLVILVDHTSFRQLNFGELDLDRVVDTRGLLSRGECT